MINKIKDFVKDKLSHFRKKDTSLLDEDISHDNISGEDYSDETPDELNPSIAPSSEKNIFSAVKNLREKFSGLKVKELKLTEKFSPKKGGGSPVLSPSLSKGIEKFLSQEAREPIHQIAIVTIICTITYSLGKVTALSLRGAPDLDSSRDYAVSLDLKDDFNPGMLAQVRNINIFRTNTGLGSKKKVADTRCFEAQQASSLPIKLVNTVVLQDSVKSMASVQIRGGRDLEELREGEQISNLAKIFKITRLEILVKNLESGICESITNDKIKDSRSPISVMSPAQSKIYKANKKMAGIDNVGNKFTISKALMDEKMKDISSILTQARAIKIQNPDGTLSFKLTEIDPEGLFPYLGLQDQDTITSINGKPIYDINEVMSLFARIKNLDSLQLGLKREGSDSVQEYSIKK